MPPVTQGRERTIAGATKISGSRLAELWMVVYNKMFDFPAILLFQLLEASVRQRYWIETGCSVAQTCQLTSEDFDKFYGLCLRKCRDIAELLREIHPFVPEEDLPGLSFHNYSKDWEEARQKGKKAVDQFWKDVEYDAKAHENVYPQVDVVNIFPEITLSDTPIGHRLLSKRHHYEQAKARGEQDKIDEYLFWAEKVAIENRQDSVRGKEAPGDDCEGKPAASLRAGVGTWQKY